MVKALVIVAHPDDETIWCGGTILRHPGWNWTILSLCRSKDRDRAPKFRKVCKKLNARCAISDLEDEHPERKLRSLNQVKSRIRKMLRKLKAGSSFDKVFTHGQHGEYGHNRHREVHRAVKEMIAGKQLKARELYFFNYKLASRGFYCVANTRGKPASGRYTRGGDNSERAGKRSARECASSKRAGAQRTRSSTRVKRVKTRLSARIAQSKRLLITSSYQFSKRSFEARSARAIESFKVKQSCDR